MSRHRDIELSPDEARRTTLAAQGFGGPRSPDLPDATALLALIRRLGVLQLDFVNVVLPSHYLVPFSRVGPYDRALLDELAYSGRELTEQWAHEASLIPAESWPLLRHRMERFRPHPRGFETFLAAHPEYVQEVLGAVRERGPLGADDLPVPPGVERRLPQSWFGSVPRAVLEALFGRGVLGVASRRADFSRTYDLIERIVPEEHRTRAIDETSARRELLLIAARAQGVGTAGDLADYLRMPVREARPALDQLLDDGELLRARVAGWRQEAYLHPTAVVPERIEAAALLSPFDPVVWTRPRTQRLFRFEYRFEIFVPAARRRWGVYVLPFLLADRLVARVDLKAERAEGRLRVAAAFLEGGADREEVVEALASEVQRLARWIGLDEVAVGRRGNLARALGVALRG